MFLISRLHEDAVAVVDRFFNRALDHLERTLSQAMGEAQATEPSTGFSPTRPGARSNSALPPPSADKDRPSCGMKTAKGGETATPGNLELRSLCSRPCPLASPSASTNERTMGPISRRVSGGRWLAVPATDPVRCFALSLDGPHAVRAVSDLNADERAMLSRLARFAAAMYAELEAVELRHRIAMLELKFNSPSWRLR